MQSHSNTGSIVLHNKEAVPQRSPGRRIRPHLDRGPTSRSRPAADPSPPLHERIEPLPSASAAVTRSHLYGSRQGYLFETIHHDRYSVTGQSPILNGGFRLDVLSTLLPSGRLSVSTREPSLRASVSDDCKEQRSLLSHYSCAGRGILHSKLYGPKFRSMILTPEPLRPRSWTLEVGAIWCQSFDNAGFTSVLVRAHSRWWVAQFL